MIKLWHIFFMFLSWMLQLTAPVKMLLLRWGIPSHHHQPSSPLLLGHPHCQLNTALNLSARHRCLPHLNHLTPCHCHHWYTFAAVLHQSSWAASPGEKGSILPPLSLPLFLSSFLSKNSSSLMPRPCPTCPRAPTIAVAAAVAIIVIDAVVPQPLWGLAPPSPVGLFLPLNPPTKCELKDGIATRAGGMRLLLWVLTQLATHLSLLCIYLSCIIYLGCGGGKRC